VFLRALDVIAVMIFYCSLMGGRKNCRNITITGWGCRFPQLGFNYWVHKNLVQEIIDRKVFSGNCDKIRGRSEAVIR
jgi:hypothetical protein